MNNGWWVLPMLVYLSEDAGDHIRKIKEDAATKEKFKEYARNCRYLELNNDGRATHRICHHPVRDDPSDWVTCDMEACPFMASGNCVMGRYQK